MADDTSAQGTNTTTTTDISSTVTSDDAPQKQGGGILLPATAGVIGAGAGGIAGARFAGGKRLAEKIGAAETEAKTSLDNIHPAVQKLGKPDVEILSGNFHTALGEHSKNVKANAAENVLQESKGKLIEAANALRPHVEKELKAFEKADKNLASLRKTEQIINETPKIKGAFTRPWKLLTEGGNKTAVIGGAVALGVIAAGVARMMSGPKEQPESFTDRVDQSRTVDQSQAATRA